MKQKRKVKSLLPQKSFVNGRFLTILLVVLSLVLCVWWVSLLTHSALAQGEECSERRIKVNHFIQTLDQYCNTGRYNAKQTVQTGCVGETITIQPTQIDSGNNYTWYAHDLTVTWNSSSYSMKYYIADPQKDINGNNVLDSKERKFSVWMKYYYSGTETKLSWDLSEDLLNGLSYSYNIPDFDYYYKNTPDTVFKWTIDECTWTGLMVRYYLNNDDNHNDIADELEYTVNYYKCKEREPFNSITGVCNYEGENVNISIPPLEGYSGVKEWEPCEWWVFPVVKITYNPEKDQNNDCVWDGEQELWEITEFDYTWLDNRVEVLYGMRFLDPSDFTKIVNSIYMSGSSLYISPNSVIVNSSSNTVDTGVYSHILWWENNEVSSNNITLIAWSNNKIHAWNDNASVLWWNGNEVMPWKSGWIPTILVGWELNKMGTGHDGNALIWWSNNTIWASEDPYADADEVSDSIVLWWEWNAIGIDSYNVIIWWKRVLVQGKHNIFVYSSIDSWFPPLSHNAFYLNVGSGVWISTGWIEWLSVGGAVSIWRVNINIDDCTEDNLWVIWSYEGCLVWCTEAWSNDNQRWELLDQGKRCASVCQSNSGYCLNQEGTEVTVNDSDAQCTTWVVDIENAHLCIDDLESYKNVIFESSLIDSENTCPTNGQNICVYQCDSGFNLKQDPLDDNKRGCYDECKLPWNPTKKIQHGETITWYNVENAVCATDSDKSPIDTCGKHKKQLICYKWKLLLKSSNWKPISWTEATAANYKYETCMLGWYRCKTDSDNYSLYVSDITAVNWYNDTPKDATVGRIVKDRTIAKWVRWNYKLCMDYDGTPPADWKNWENCSTWDITPTPYHYKFVGCNTWDHYMLVNGVCKQQCSLTNSSGDLERYDHGKVETGFKENLVACPGKCTWVQLTCDDGSWKLDGETVTWYYNYCNNGEVQCDSSYNLTEQKSWWVYSSCTSYEQGTCKETTKYKLDGCADWYHLEWWICVENSRKEPCKHEWAPSNADYKEEYVTLNWGSGGWSSPALCSRECKAGYITGYDESNKPISCINPACWSDANTCVDSGAIVTEENNSGDGSGAIWTCKAANNNSNVNWCAKCDEGSYRTGENETLKCDANLTWECINEGSFPYLCAVWLKHDRNENIGAWYTWECLWIPQENENLKSDLCHKCKDNAEWNGERCECWDGYDEVNDGGQIVCMQPEHKCSKTEKFKCVNSSGDLVDWVNTWYDSVSHQYTWNCGEYDCPMCEDGYSPDDDGNCVKDNQGTYQICRNVEYETCGVTEGVKSVDFMVNGDYLNDSSLQIIQKFVFKNLMEWMSESYETAQCSWIWQHGGWQWVYCNPDPNVEMKAIGSLGCQNNRWMQYTESLWEVEISWGYLNFEYIGDCHEDDLPKCWNSIDTCAEWINGWYNSESESWYCSNNWYTVKCKNVCNYKCPSGYILSSGKCKLNEVKYCATQVMRQQFNDWGCNSVWSEWYSPSGIIGNTCFGTSVGGWWWSSFWNFPRQLIPWWHHCWDKGMLFFDSYDWHNGLYYLEKYESNGCNVLIYGDVLEDCYQNLDKYRGENWDVWYKISSCDSYDNIDPCKVNCHIQEASM